jgi:hypothetical protein
MRLASSLDLLHQIDILLKRLIFPSFWILLRKMIYNVEKQAGQCFSKRIDCYYPFVFNEELNDSVFRSVAMKLKSVEDSAYSKLSFALQKLIMNFKGEDFNSPINSIQDDQNSFFGGDLPLPIPIMILW